MSEIHINEMRVGYSLRYSSFTHPFKFNLIKAIQFPFFSEMHEMHEEGEKNCEIDLRHTFPAFIPSIEFD